jgi:hypothetical protein
MPVQLANFDLCTRFTMRQVNAGHRDIFAQKWRSHGRTHLPNLRTPDVDAITVSNIDRAVDIQADQLPHRVFLAPDQSIASNEIIGFGF